MTDQFCIEVIARRIDDECPWSKGATILKHQDWKDVVEHLWHDKKLKTALKQAYQSDLMRAHSVWLMEHASESDGMPL